MTFLNKKQWTDWCSSLCLSSLQAVSINKAINTQEVAVKEKHARNILPLSCVFVFTEGYVGSKDLIITAGLIKKAQNYRDLFNFLKLNKMKGPLQ